MDRSNSPAIEWDILVSNTGSFSRPRTLDLSPWESHCREVGDVWAQVSELLVHCQLGSPEPEFLFSLSYLSGERGAVVEIGTNVGTSLLMLSAAQRLKGPRGRRVTTIDLLKHPELDATLERVRLQPFVDVIVGDSKDIARNWAQPIELLWIDGDHSRLGCVADIEAWSHHVLPDGLIALHDYADGMGVPRAVYDTLLARPWQYRVISDRAYGNIFVLEKLTASESIWTDRMSPIPTVANSSVPVRGTWRAKLREFLGRSTSTP